jgi:hypothetical protein
MQRFKCDRPLPCSVPAEFPKLGIATFAEEPSLFSNSPIGVRAQGGSLSKIALHHVEEQYASEIRRAEKAGLSAVVDVRVQRLMPGMYPSIPGWHCDAVPRNSYHGQPDFDLIDPAAFHVCVLLSSEPCGVSNTQYVDQHMVFKLWQSPERTVYRQLHEEVEKHKPQLIHVKDGEFIKFTPHTVHRAMPTLRRGWRMFFRYSMYHKPPLENKIANCQQVYILSEANGW